MEANETCDDDDIRQKLGVVLQGLEKQLLEEFRSALSRRGLNTSRFSSSTLVTGPGPPKTKLTSAEEVNFEQGPPKTKSALKGTTAPQKNDEKKKSSIDGDAQESPKVPKGVFFGKPKSSEIRGSVQIAGSAGTQDKPAEPRPPGTVGSPETPPHDIPMLPVEKGDATKVVNLPSSQALQKSSKNSMEMENLDLLDEVGLSNGLEGTESFKVAPARCVQAVDDGSESSQSKDSIENMIYLASCPLETLQEGLQEDARGSCISGVDEGVIINAQLNLNTMNSNTLRIPLQQFPQKVTQQQFPQKDIKSDNERPGGKRAGRRASTMPSSVAASTRNSSASEFSLWSAVPSATVISMTGLSSSRSLAHRESVDSNTSVLSVLSRLKRGTRALTSIDYSRMSNVQDVIAQIRHEVGATLLKQVKRKLKVSFGESDSESQSGSEIMVPGVDAAVAVEREEKPDAFKADSSDSDGDAEITTHLWLAPAWMESNGKSLRNTASGKTLNFAMAAKHQEQAQQDGAEYTGASTWLGRLAEPYIIRPTSWLRICWAIPGFVLFGYDACFLPLTVFDIKESVWVTMADWAVRMYWSSDVIVCFFTGFLQHRTASVEMRPEKIWSKYLKTWFFFDMALVLMTWFELLAQAMDSRTIDAVRFGKVARTCRTFRTFRFFELIRRIRLPSVIRGWIYYWTERFIILFGIMKIIFLIICVTHIIACMWYGSGFGKRILTNNHEMDQSFSHKYVASFLWAIAHVTGISESDRPETHDERLLVIGILLFSFIFSAYSISSITSAMTELHIIMAQHTERLQLLRRYLHSHEVSKGLAMRIQKSAQNAAMEKIHHTDEADVELLALVSEPLRMELHREAHGPKLEKHPFFLCYAMEFHGAMLQICHNAVSTISHHKEDILFCNGDLPEEVDMKMYFLVEGRSVYLHGNVNAHQMRPVTWACEGALWTFWCHQGTLKVVKESTWLYVHAGRFQRAAVQFMSRDAQVVRYAKEFVRFHNALSPGQRTDLNHPEFMIRDVAWEAMFPNIESFGKRRFSSARKLSAQLGHLAGPQGPFRRLSVMSLRGSFLGGNAAKVAPTIDVIAEN